MNITLELAQAIADYLTTKPYREVFALIGELQKQANVTPAEAKEKDKNETESK